MREITLKPYVKAFLDHEKSMVTLSRPFRDDGNALTFTLSPVGLAIFSKVEESLPLQTMKEQVLQQFPSQEEAEEFDQIMQFLLHENYIEESSDVKPSGAEELERQYGRLLPVWSEFETSENDRYQIQQNIMSKKVGVIGCGTIGLGVISKLTVSGVSRFVLMDEDCVEESNLARQPLFSLQHIGQAKVDVAKEFILQRKKDAAVAVLKRSAVCEADLAVFEDVDILVVAGDYPSYQELGLLVHRFAQPRGIAVSYAGGYNAHVGKIYPLVIPGKTVCFACMCRQAADESSKYGRRISNGNIAVSTTVQMSEFITSIVSFEIMRYLSGVVSPFLINKRMVVTFSSYTIETSPYQSQADCACSQQQTESVGT